MLKPSNGNRVKLAIKLIMIAGLLMVIGGYTDAWWHVHIRRENFWIPPHLVIYSGLITIVTLFPYLFLRGNLGREKWGAVIGILMMLTAPPIDNWWHETHPPEVGLDLMSPPHMYFALGGAITGISIIHSVAKKARNDHELRKYVFIYILAGYLMSMQAIGLLDPSNPTVIGYFGSVLFPGVPVGFYVFTKKIFNSSYVTILALSEGIAKTLLEGNLLYLPSIVSSGLFIAQFKNLKNSNSWCLVYGVVMGVILGSYLLFSISSVGFETIAFRYVIGVLTGACIGILANYESKIFVKMFRW